jgi:hypothetical protein
VVLATPWAVTSGCLPWQNKDISSSYTPGAHSCHTITFVTSFNVSRNHNHPMHYVCTWVHASNLLHVLGGPLVQVWCLLTRPVGGNASRMSEGVW